MNIPTLVWTLIGILINILWTALNMRTLSEMKDEIRKEFMSRPECTLKHAACDERHQAVCARLVQLEAWHAHEN